MPDEGQLPCIIDATPPVETESYSASLDIHMGCPIAKEVSQTLKVSTARGYGTAVAVVPKTPVAFIKNDILGRPSVSTDIAPTLRSAVNPAVAIPIDTMNATERPSNRSPKCGVGENGDPAPTLSKTHHHAVCTGEESAGIVRRLLPLECERLMGFPDNYTQIAWKGKSPEECPDSPRYKACGNSMCVNVMAWVGRRIQENEEKHQCQASPPA